MLFQLLTKLVFVPNEQGEIVKQELPLPLESVSEMPTTDYGSAIFQMLIAFIVVITLLFATFWFLRRLIQNRLQKGAENQAIQILEKRMLSPKTMLYLVEVDSKKILIAESHLEIRKLETLL